MNQQNNLSNNENAMDVTSQETHFSIQCADIRLISSLFRPLNEADDIPDDSRFSFNLSAYVQGHEAYSHLETQVFYLSSQEPGERMGYFLRFGLVAKFMGDEVIDSEQMAEFARYYTLSILWPYAREYAGDQLRRAGEECLSLPIINPQVVTERLVEDNLIRVEILSEK